jgi:hypothetical protein
LEFVNCLLETATGAKLAEEFDRSTHLVDRRNLKDARIAEVHEAIVLVLLQ